VVVAALCVVSDILDKRKKKAKKLARIFSFESVYKTNSHREYILLETVDSFYLAASSNLALSGVFFKSMRDFT
jgi:hypothetical protein